MPLNNEFIHLYYSLSDSERKMFTIYVNKNYPSKEKNIEVLNYLKSTNGEIANYNKDKLIKKLKLKLNKSKFLGNQMSELYSKCQEWLILESYKNENIDAKILLLKTMNQRNFNEKAYQKWNKKIAKSLIQVPYRDASYHYLCWQQSHLSVFRTSHRHIEDDSKELLLNKSEEELDNFYALTKLQYYYERIAISRIKNTKNNKFSQTEIASFTRKQLATKAPLIRYFANIIQAEITDDNSFYDTALGILSTCDHEISPSKLPSYYACLSNFAIKKINEKDGMQRLFDLQNLGLERDWITGGGQITTSSFLGLINIGCHLGKIDLVNKIISNFASRLPIEQKNGCVIYAEARILFAEKKFNLTIQKLKTIPWDFELASFQVQSLMARSYYEIRSEDFESSRRYCVNFKRNISNSKHLSNTNKLRFLNFIKITLKFFRKNTDWEKLRFEINQTKEIVCKNWLLNKVNEEL